MNCISCGDLIATPAHFLCPACRETGGDPPTDDPDPGPPPWERGDAGAAAYRQWTRDRARFLRAFAAMVSADKLRLACAFTEYWNFAEQPITPHHAAETLTLWYAALDAAEEDVTGNHA